MLSGCTVSTNYNWNNRLFHISQFFQFPRNAQVLILLFTFFQLYFVVNRDSKVHNSGGLGVFFVDYYKAWSSGQDWAIRLYLKIKSCLILQNKIGVVYIPFFRMVKYQFLAQLPVDRLA